MQQAVRATLIAFMAATAQAQAEATKSAQRAGIDQRRSTAPSPCQPQAKLHVPAARPCSVHPFERSRPKPLDHRPRRGPDKTDRLPHQGRPAGRRVSVGCAGSVGPDVRAGPHGDEQSSPAIDAHNNGPLLCSSQATKVRHKGNAP
jgi:hypothetical protein